MSTALAGLNAKQGRFSVAANNITLLIGLAHECRADSLQHESYCENSERLVVTFEAYNACERLPNGILQECGMCMAKCYGRRLVLCSGACAAVFNASIQEVIRIAYREEGCVSLVEHDEPVTISAADAVLSNETQLIA